MLSLLATTLLPQAQASDLYSFSSMMFTNCGATGQNGPTLSQCATNTYSAQSWTSNTSNFNVISGIQYWTVPANGNYTITAAGAKGGGTAGGLGAIETGTFTLTQGSIIQILVGQRGGGASTMGSGGGGTFVVASPYNTNQSILVIAGGGGGYRVSACNNSAGGQTTQSPTGGSQSAASGGGGGGSSTQAGGVGFTNGGAVGTSVWAGGGAGFGGNGGRYNNNATASGLSFINGGKGGDLVGAGSVGGFGGGGGTGDRAAGGGGYSGGNGEDLLCGIGGGSYNSGSNISEVANANNGHGYVFISLNQIPTTTSLQLTSGALTATYRTSVQLKATASVDGFILFRQNGKNIPGCIRVATTSSIAYCNWSPSNRGSIRLTASFIANGSYTSSTSAPINVRVSNRASIR